MVSRWAPVLVGQLPGSLSEAAAEGRDFIEWSDKVADEWNVPIVEQTIALQSKVFAIADDLGVGDEVRAMVYAIRGAHYVGFAAANLGLVGPGGLAAGTGAAGLAASGLAASLGGFGALAAGGVVGVVVGLLAFLSGGDSDAELAQKRSKARDRARGNLLDLLQPMTLDGFAKEQDKVANAFVFGADLPAYPGSIAAMQKQERDARKASAAKLASFYRAADKQLNSRERQLFTAMMNVARWGHALDLYSALSASAKQSVSTLAYEGGWKLQPKPGPGFQPQEAAPLSPIVDFGVRLKAKLDAGLSKLGGARSGSSGGGATVLLVAVAAAGAAYVAPGQASALLGAAKGFGGRLWSGARRLIP